MNGCENLCLQFFQHFMVCTTFLQHNSTTTAPFNRMQYCPVRFGVAWDVFSTSACIQQNCHHIERVTCQSHLEWVFSDHAFAHPPKYVRVKFSFILACDSVDCELCRHSNIAYDGIILLLSWYLEHEISKHNYNFETHTHTSTSILMKSSEWFWHRNYTVYITAN